MISSTSNSTVCSSSKWLQKKTSDCKKKGGGARPPRPPTFYYFYWAVELKWLDSIRMLFTLWTKSIPQITNPCHFRPSHILNHIDNFICKSLHHFRWLISGIHAKQHITPESSHWITTESYTNWKSYVYFLLDHRANQVKLKPAHYLKILKNIFSLKVFTVKISHEWKSL